MVESLWSKWNKLFSTILLSLQRNTSHVKAAHQTSTWRCNRILLKYVLASSYSQGEESIFCQYLLHSQQLMHGLMNYPFTAEKSGFRITFQVALGIKWWVLSCSLMDSVTCPRNPPLPFSSIPTCAVICNIWQYQPEMGVTENCGQSCDTLKNHWLGKSRAALLSY